MDNAVRVLWGAGRAGRLVAARIKPGRDLIEGIESICQQAGVRQGTVVCCFGSLRQCSVMWVRPIESAKAGAGYTEPFTVPGPVEFLSSQGTVVPTPTGELFVHLHGLVADVSGRVYGGHIVKGRSPVLLTVEMVLAEVVGPSLSSEFDEEVQLPELVIREATI